MVIKPGCGVAHIFADKRELTAYIGVISAVGIAGVAGHSEGLSHKKPVEPDLVGVYLFMPIAARRGSGLISELFKEPFNSELIAFLPRFGIREDQRTPGENVVEFIILGAVAFDFAGNRNI